jgi:hypothetical protein
MNRSPTRYEFSTKRHIEKLKKDPHDENALFMVKHYTEADEKDITLSEDPEWCKDNLEYDLRTTEWIIEKAKCDKIYAQHLYAAICNNDFTRNDAWPILTEKKWSCSWRHAGGIIADMREEGDYMSWYCSGIVDNIEIDTELNNAANPLSQHERERMLELKAHVAESVVTDEIREDLLKLGWIVIADDSWTK